MHDEQPRQTALAAAAARAAHLVVDSEPLIFRDPDRSPTAQAWTAGCGCSKWTTRHPALDAGPADRCPYRPPEGLAFVGVDLESDPLADRLAGEGFDPSQPALVSWLGVSFYLTRDAIAATLAAIGGLASGTELVAEDAMARRSAGP